MQEIIKGALSYNYYLYPALHRQAQFSSWFLSGSEQQSLMLLGLVLKLCMDTALPSGWAEFN